VAGQVAPVTLPGDSALYVSVGLRDGTPRIALPLSGDDGQHRYKLGQVVLRKKGGKIVRWEHLGVNLPLGGRV
jgi:hypothetical protein